MSVVVTVPHQAEPWMVSGAAFQLLVSEVQDLTSDSEFMVRAAALNGLDLGMETPVELNARRLCWPRRLSASEPSCWLAPHRTSGR